MTYTHVNKLFIEIYFLLLLYIIFDNNKIHCIKKYNIFEINF